METRVIRKVSMGCLRACTFNLLDIFLCVMLMLVERSLEKLTTNLVQLTRVLPDN